jgi:hypothetical protein
MVPSRHCRLWLITRHQEAAPSATMRALQSFPGMSWGPLQTHSWQREDGRQKAGTDSDDDNSDNRAKKADKATTCARKLPDRRTRSFVFVRVKMTWPNSHTVLDAGPLISMAWCCSPPGCPTLWRHNSLTLTFTLASPSGLPPALDHHNLGAIDRSGFASH